MQISQTNTPATPAISVTLKNKTITKSVTVKQIRFLGCFHLLLHLLQKLNLLMKHVGRKLSCFSDMSSTRKSRSHCSRDRETPGSSEAAARYIASRYLSAVSPNFFKYQVLAIPRFEVVFPYFAALLNICGWVVLRNLLNSFYEVFDGMFILNRHLSAVFFTACNCQLTVVTVVLK